MMGDIQHLQLPAIQAALLQHFDHANHTVHRRADLVAHGGKKGRFGTAGLLCLQPGMRQFVGARQHFPFQLRVEAVEFIDQFGGVCRGVVECRHQFADLVARTKIHAYAPLTCGETPG